MKRLLLTFAAFFIINAVCSEETDDNVKTNSPQYVDLGLSVFWSTTNLGAHTPEEYGDYYAWGEIIPKSDYSWSGYSYCTDGKGKFFSKYVLKKRNGASDFEYELDLSDDAAFASLGGKWRMPTQQEQYEMRHECRLVIEELNGIKGYRVYSKVNKNSIFIPFAGTFSNEKKEHAGDYGAYWTNELYTKRDLFHRSSSQALMFVFLSDDTGQGCSPRYIGLPIRPVWDPNLNE